jgi:hypothetical protein
MPASAARADHAPNIFARHAPVAQLLRFAYRGAEQWPLAISLDVGGIDIGIEKRFQLVMGAVVALNVEDYFAQKKRWWPR